MVRLAAAGGAHQGDGFARPHPQREVAQHRLVLVVKEFDVIELDLTLQAAGVDGVRPVHHLGHGVDQREHALARGDGVLHISIHARHVLDGPEHEGDIGHEGLDAADGDEPGAGLQPAKPGNAAQRHGADDLHRRQEQGRQPGGVVGRAIHLAGELAELARVAVLAPQGLDHAHARDVLVIGAGDPRVELARRAELHQDLLAKLDGHVDQDGRMVSTTSASRQLMMSMKIGRAQDVERGPGAVEQTPGESARPPGPSPK